MRWDGVVPQVAGRAVEPSDIRAIATEARRVRGESPFAIVAEGSSVPGEAEWLARVAAYREAGATWWVESFWANPNPNGVRARLRAGPPRVYSAGL
jgi:hypothetical protein